MIPATSETTGIAFHYDRPGHRAAAGDAARRRRPTRPGRWQWDDLVAALNETLDLAKLRAVEPAQLDSTAYAQLLPATVMAATPRPITICTDLAHQQPAERPWWTTMT